MQREPDIFRPQARRQPVAGMVGKLHCLIRRPEGHGHSNRAEDFLGRDGRAGGHIGQKRGREERPITRNRVRWLVNLSTFLDPLLNEARYPIELHGRNDRAHVDGLIERRTDAQRFHAALQLGDERIRNAFL